MLFLTWSHLTLYFSVLLCWIYEKISRKCFYFRKLVILCLLSLALNGFCLFSFAFGEITVFTLLRRFKKTFLASLFGNFFVGFLRLSVTYLLYAPSFLIIRLEIPRKCLQFFYSWVFLSISFVFLSIVSRFLCNFLDVMQFSRYNSIASLFGNFFEHLLRSFSHVFLYAPSLAHWFSSNFLKNACNIFLKVEPSKLNSSLFSP